MKVFISIDMEGISGVVNSEQCTPGNPEYERARLLMTQEANAAILGARAAGATEVVVSDSHGGMRNLLIEELDTWADLICGSPKPFGMMEGLDDSFGVVFMVGYHARAGTPANGDGQASHRQPGRYLPAPGRGAKYDPPGRRACHQH